MKLRDYILQFYNGRNADFVRANNKPENKLSDQLVGQMIKRGTWHVIDGMLVNAKCEVK